MDHDDDENAVGKRQWRGAPREIGAGLNTAFFFSLFV